MRKFFFSLFVGIVVTSCGSYTEEQGRAADAMCECMDKDAYGDFDINWFECDAEVNATYSPEIFEEDSWIKALEEKCPNVAEKLEE